jgi:acyl-CoA thioesterase
MARKPDTQNLGLRNYQHPDKFGEWLGYQVASIDTQAHTAQVELEIREDHLSPAGKVHGGVVSAFFDFACGAAVFSTLEPNDFCSTVELKVNYFHPLHLGDRLIAKTEVVFRGKKLCVVHGRLFLGRPDPKRGGPSGALAMVTATFNVVTPKPASQGTEPNPHPEGG